MTQNRFDWYGDGGFGGDSGDLKWKELLQCPNSVSKGKEIVPLSKCALAQRQVMKFSETGGKQTAIKTISFLRESTVPIRLGLDGLTASSEITQRTALQALPKFKQVNYVIHMYITCFLVDPRTPHHRELWEFLEQTMNKEKEPVLDLLENQFQNKMEGYEGVNGVARYSHRLALNGPFRDSNPCVNCEGKPDGALDQKASLQFIRGFDEAFVEGRIFLCK